MLQHPKRLKGMQDLDPDASAVADSVGGALRAFLARYGYQRIDLPTLEQTDLLLRKSGGELASQMYTFTDPGGRRVSLRPEFTSSVVRAYLEGLNAGPLPLRCCYVGPVFRYHGEDAADPRQFTQAGAELIGADGPWIDAEVMALAVNGLGHLGLPGCRLVVGHLGFIGALLEGLGLSDRARMFLMSSLWQLGGGDDGLTDVKRRATDLGLLRQGNGDDDGLAGDVPPDVASALLERYFQAASTATIGVRTPQEVRERFLRKRALAQDSGRFEDALALLAKIAQVRGDPASGLRQVRAMVEDATPLAADLFEVREQSLRHMGPATVTAMAELDRLEETLGALAHYGVKGQTSLDLGLGRGIAYYTGVVFEVRSPSGDGVSLGGGGRYDGLVQALGGPAPTPAMGFAWTLERVVDLLARAGKERRWKRREDMVLVRAGSPSALAMALREADVLRDQGISVVFDPAGGADKEALAYAQARGIRRISTVDDSGKVAYKDVPERQ
ncbi:MAG: ATP phosphoribosyltransferase regulatory subunit [Chloroflexi bacterium]|nr:ATP phosphoribosyltransferase regulatory subunit [Chloroflexota bacterium]